MKRDMIEIDEEKCTGCGLCVPGCPEGALQIIDGKARLVSDLLCDGLGACVGECPEGALTVTKKEAPPYDERRAMENIVKAGANTIKAHLKHLYDHGEKQYLAEAAAFLKEKNIPVPEYKKEHAAPGGGCPGMKTFDLSEEKTHRQGQADECPSELKQWPVQLHLMQPGASYLKNADLLLAADCTAFAAGGFHGEYLKGKTLAIACPKLDAGTDIYTEKITAFIDEAGINTLTVLMMEVPCCGGLLNIAQKAAESAGRKIPIKAVVINMRGEKIKEEWV
ncbi:MAG: ATP-binding protein [Candidatus Goldiibacteriota bacterium]